MVSRHLPGRDVKVVVVPGMTEEQMTEYVKTLSLEDSSLSAGQIVRYSMGIPLLAKQFAQSGATEEVVLKMAAHHLRASIGGSYDKALYDEAIEKYLRIRPPENVLLALEESSHDTDSWSYLLNKVFKRWTKLRDQGHLYRSPLFLAPESNKIYEDMVRGSERFRKNSIDIFVPIMSQKDLTRIGDELTSRGNNALYDQLSSTRLGIFGVMDKKIAFWHRDIIGTQFVQEKDYEKIEEEALKFWGAYQDYRLPMQVEHRTNIASFFVHADDHEHMPRNPLLIGWAMETLLQQLKIPYFVNNYIYGASYVYSPDEQRIIEQDSLLTI